MRILVACPCNGSHHIAKKTVQRLGVELGEACELLEVEVAHYRKNSHSPAHRLTGLPAHPLTGFPHLLSPLKR